MTGRTLESLLEDFGPVDLFDRVVVENGGVIYQPEDGRGDCFGLPSPDGIFGGSPGGRYWSFSRGQGCGFDPPSFRYFG